MILQAVSDLGLDPVRCVLLGDKISDVEAGAAAEIVLRILLGAALRQERAGHAIA
jgi:beta-phosphoglucomutase-like phosphatase (HAD superfamily)